MRKGRRYHGRTKALDLAAESVAKPEEKYPDENRPREALEAARAWAAGKIKMRPARRKILDCHALGYPMYELSAIVYRLGLENCAEAVGQRRQEYIKWCYDTNNL